MWLDIEYPMLVQLLAWPDKDLQAPSFQQCLYLVASTFPLWILDIATNARMLAAAVGVDVGVAVGVTPTGSPKMA